MKKFFFSLLIFFTFVIFLLVLFLGVIFLKYQSWETEFESNINTEYLIDEDSIKEVDFSGKISEFTLSFQDTQSLQLSVKEIGSVLFSVLDTYIGDEVALESLYIAPADNIWIIYAKVKYQDISVWVSSDINKDDIQSAQVYVTDIKIGPFSVGGYSNLVDMINRGIGEAIVTLNENGLVGRYIENIELQEDSVVLKGSRY